MEKNILVDSLPYSDGIVVRSALAAATIICKVDTADEIVCMAGIDFNNSVSWPGISACDRPIVGD